MKIDYGSFNGLFLIHKKLNKKIFVAKVGAKTGHSVNMFSRMFDCIFYELINVDSEFKKYYKFEYKSLDNFLYKKLNIDEDSISLLMKVRKKNPDCILYRKPDSVGGYYNLIQFAFSETLNERITNILLLNKLKK